LRFTNHDVGKHLDGVLTAILIAFEQASDRWPSSSPHPCLSPEGEGR
jgi:hypothetical protein